MFYLTLHLTHFIYGYTASKRLNGLLFSINNKGSFIFTIQMIDTDYKMGLSTHLTPSRSKHIKKTL